MCGIVGAFYNQAQSREELSYLLKNAVNKIYHRGPDSQNYWINDRCTAALGHARLSIVDLDNGQQPFFSDDNSIVVIANGELYDFKTIRESLSREGYKFKTKSDCEILVPLYQKYGLGLFDHLIGEFSFIIYDMFKNIVIAARDRFGIKPLFYNYQDGNIKIASEIKSLLELGVQPEWNFDTVFQDDFFIPSAQNTYFKCVQAIRPAHFLLIKNGQISEKPYWDFKYDYQYPERPEQEYIDELRDLLDLCVKTRLHGDVPIGCYVSGGIDSSIIVGLANKLYDKPVTSYTIKFTDQNYDESHLSKQVAEYNSVNYIEVEVDEKKIADNYRTAIWHNEGLIYNAQGVAKYLLSKKVNECGGKVVLTGEGADEIFAGYPFFREDLEMNSKALRETNQLVAGAFLPEGNYDNFFVDVKKNILDVPSMWRVGAKFGTQFINLYSEKALDALGTRNLYDEALCNFDTYKIRNFNKLNKSLYLWSKTKLPQVILGFLGDRMEMSNSIEGRLPFLDHRMVEFAQKLPTNMKINNMIEKYILREAAKEIVPEFIYKRQKFPFTAPSIVNARDKGVSPLHSMLLDYLSSTYTKTVPFYDRSKILAWLEKVPDLSLSQRAGIDPIVNRILSAAILSEQYSMTG